MEYCCLQGKIIPRHEGKISIDDRGVLFGDGLFETIRVYRGKPFLLDEHLERLANGCRVIKIKIDLTEIRSSLTQLLDINKVTDGFLRITVTRGVTCRSLTPIYQKGTCFITCRASLPYNSDQYEKGFRAAVVTPRRNPSSPTTRLKSLNFLDNILAKAEAAQKGVDEGIFLNTQGFLTEGTISNLFIIKEGILYTPPVSAGLLPGITRQYVMGLANEIKIPLKEKNLAPQELLLGDEAFLTNSLLEIMPLVEVDQNLIGSGKPGPITRQLQAAYLKSVLNCLHDTLFE